MDRGTRSLHLFIAGRVQGVGFRAFVEREARGRGLTGWVRNLADGRVEAVLQGNDKAVEATLEACRKGPPGAQVRALEAGEYGGPLTERFLVLPTK